MASFNGAAFKERGDGTFFSLPGGKVAYEMVTLAGGGQAYRPSGQVERTAKITVLCTAAELTALRAQIGKVGTLELGAGSASDCLLEEVSKPSEVLTTRLFEVELSFVVGVDAVQQFKVTVAVNGITVKNVVGLSTSAGKSQPVATATLTCFTKPSGQEGDSATIYVSINGATAVALWQGRVDAFSYDYYPGLVTVECKGRMSLLSQPWGSEVERVYCEANGNSDDAAIIRNLIEAWGYPSTIANIESSDWTLGSIQELVVKQGDRFSDIIQQIDEIAGYYTYDDGADGGIYRRQQQPSGAGGSASATLTEGENILRISRKRGGAEGIINHAIVEGLTYEGVEVKQEYKATSSVLDHISPGTAPNYHARTLKSDLIETDTKALEVATRMVTDGNRRQDSLEVTTFLNPAITPGVSVTVNAPSVGAASAFLVVDQVKHSVQGETGITTFTTNAGNLA